MRRFDKIVAEYGPRLYAHIRRMVVIHEEADDILQNTFIKAWEKQESFRGDAKVSTWLYRIATNEALDHLRKEKRRRNIPLDDAASWLLTEQEHTFHPDADEIIRHLHKAMHTLPERQHTVFQLKYFEEMTYDQISEITNVSVGALKASYHHAVKKIEEYIRGVLNQEVTFTSN